MSRVMSQMSLDAYFSEVKPNLTDREEWVLSAIETLGEASADTVANYYGVGVNVISGRFTGLRKKMQIVPSRRGINRWGRSVQYWKPARQEVLREHE